MAETPGSRLISALERLHPTGPKSFEELIRRLLAPVAGVPMRRCRSGRQFGIDALGELPIAAEFKRWSSRPPPPRDLKGGLTEAHERFPDLQLWILATTADLGSVALEIDATAAGHGLAALFLDAASFRPPLPDGVHALAALCASDAPLAIAALSDPEWFERGTPPFPAELIGDDLSRVGALAEIPAFVAAIQAKVRELPAWALLVKRRNASLKQQILKASDARFSTPYDQALAVSRKVEALLARWLEDSLAGRGEPAVVLGEKYEGKTWAVFNWLVRSLDSLPVPVFLVGSAEGDLGPPLDQQIVEQAADALGPFRRHAAAVIERARLAPGSEPWAVIVFDGLNEYSNESAPWRTHFVAATAHDDPDRRGAAVLCTARTPYWDQWAERAERAAGTSLRLLNVGPYDDDELAAALRLTKISTERFVRCSPGAQKLLRNPRCLRLAGGALERGDYPITEDSLLFLDLTEKIGKRHGLPPGWNERSAQGVLRKLARRHLRSRRLRPEEVRRTIGLFTEGVSRAVSELESQGVLVPTADGYTLCSEPLRAGVALYLLDVLDEAEVTGRDPEEELAAATSPLRDLDLFADATTAAAVFALLRDPPLSEPSTDVLVRAALSSRNVDARAQRELQSLAPRLLRPLLRLAPSAWSRSGGNRRLQAVSRAVFASLIGDSSGEIGDAVRRWFRTLPREGGWHLREQPNAAETISEGLADPGIQDLGLAATGDTGVFDLHDLGLYLESCSPGLVDSLDLLALLVGDRIAQEWEDDGTHWILRRSLEPVPRTWFEEQVSRCDHNKSGYRARALRELIQSADRADLEDAMARLTPADQEQWRTPRLHTLDESDYERLRDSPLAGEEQPLDLLSNAARVALNPEVLPPARARLDAMRTAYIAKFQGARLHLDRSPTSEDHLIDQTLAAAARWLPADVAAIIREQIRDLPSRLGTPEHWWAFSLARHATLLDGELRAPLLAAALQPTADETWLSSGLSLRALLPSLSAQELLSAIVDHPFPIEWSILYELAGELGTDAVAEAAIGMLGNETVGPRRRRLLLVLAEMGGRNPPSALDSAIQSAFQSPDSEESGAAVAAAARWNSAALTNGELLDAVLRWPGEGSLAPRWAASLLVRRRAMTSKLPPYWRAVAGSLNPVLAASFLDTLEQRLASRAPAVARRLGVTVQVRTEEPETLTSHRLGLPSTTDTVVMGGGSGPQGVDRGTSMFRDLAEQLDEAAQAEKRRGLLREASAIARIAEESLDDAWEWEVLPWRLLATVPASKVVAWTALLLARPGDERERLQGLALPVLRRALEIGSAAARELWLGFAPAPFGQGSSHVRLVRSDIDLIIFELSRPSADDALASEILREAVLAARNDRELLQLALAARFVDAHRLARVATSLLSEPVTERRARAARLLGWLPSAAVELAGAAATDPSLWVRRVATAAIRDRAREVHAKHWWQLFTTTDSGATERWAAGQLFLACQDPMAATWTPQTLTAGVDKKMLGVARLLLEALASDEKSRTAELGSKLLGFKVADLARGVFPWRPAEFSET